MNAKRRDAGDAALHTIRKLRAAGHVALLAGGCVRDRLLGREPKDYDVVTDATPPSILSIFPRARQVGAKFGVILVRQFGHDIEVATFRADGPYSDGRHPDAVTFGSDIEDAQRRDFTINGLFLDPTDDRVIDYVNGRADLAAGIIRTIGDPDRRFTEDHLRMLRAVRFAARLGFRIERETWEAIGRHAGHLESISAERVWMELDLILGDPSRAAAWSLLVDTGLREHLVPGWRSLRGEDETTGARLAALPHRVVPSALALATVLADRTTEETTTVGRALRLSNRLVKGVGWMVGCLPRLREADSLELADLKLLMAEGPWADLLELLRADLEANGGDPVVYERLRARASAIPPGEVTPPPLLTGDDLVELGFPPGPRMGRVLDAVYRAQLNMDIQTRERALAAAKSFVTGGGSI